MKAPPKPFVVEIKSGRRRSQLQPKSIWAGTDFHALVREAKSDAPHLFSPSEPQVPFVDIDEQPFSARPVASNQESTAAGLGNDPDIRPDVDGEVRPIAATAPPVDAAQPTQKSAFFVPLDTEPQPAAQEALSKRSARGRAATSGMARTVIDRRTGLSMSGVVTGPDEIERLTRENQRLKTLLVAQLRQENRWLCEKLSRFAPTGDG